MTLKRLGKDLSSADHWAALNDTYAGETSGSYHAHRLAMVRSLFDVAAFQSTTVLDFACGDGVMLLDFPKAKRIGIEQDEGFLRIAQKNVPRAQFIHGDVSTIAQVADASVDLLLALNVAAYFTDEEDDTFYRLASRAMKPGGTLVITHSNALFDLFTFNAFTVDFFKEHFACDPTDLLRHPAKPHRPSFNIRENPLTYATKLERHGFQQVKQGFSNFHTRPPLQGADENIHAKTYRDTVVFPEAERWKLMFQCSTFGVSARLKG